MKYGVRIFRFGVLLTVILLLLLLFLYDKTGVGFIGLLMLAVAYLTGVMAFLAGLAYSMWAYVVVLPVISWLYGMLVSAVLLVYHILFGKMVGMVLDRIPQLKKFEMKVRNSRVMKGIRAHTIGVLEKAGVRSPHRMVFIKVMECTKCRKDIPSDSRVCPYCSLRVKTKNNVGTQG